jgi:FMN phosphatase YigB (HAD superfamily)
VLIDLDDTCIPDRAGTESAVASLLAELGAPADPGSVERRLIAARTLWRSGPHYQYCLDMGISSWEGLWLESPSTPRGFGDWIGRYQHSAWDDLQVAADASDAARGHPLVVSERYREIRAAHGEPFADVPATLAALRTRHRVWLMTNGESALQRRKVSLAGLTECFDSIIVSAEVGAGKPSDGFSNHIEELLRESGCTVVLAVGDSMDNDVRPALARGWPAALVRREDPGRHSDVGVPVVSRASEILPLTEHGRRQAAARQA